MNDEERSREQLISAMEGMQQQIEQLEALQRQYEKALHDSQQQLQQPDKFRRHVPVATTLRL